MKLEPLIYVSDLRKSIEFYIDLLGFRLGELFPDKENPTYAPVIAGENKLMLCLARESNEKFYPKGLGGSGTQLFIRVDNVDGVWEKVKDKAEVVDPIETKTWGDREFTVKDPDGYLVSFYTPADAGADSPLPRQPADSRGKKVCKDITSDEKVAKILALFSNILLFTSFNQRCISGFEFRDITFYCFGKRKVRHYQSSPPLVAAQHLYY
jgi:uncharacterized glyoxalase superfamily protein PhnB